MFEERYFKDKYGDYKLTNYVKALFLAKLRILIEFQRKWGIPKAKCKILDIGCGYGHFILLGGKMGYDTFGCDVSCYALAHAKKLAVNAYLIRCDSQKLPFFDGSFDVITMFEVIEHLESPRNAVNEAYRVLRDNGILFLSTPNKIGFREFLANYTPLIDRDETHKNIMTKGQIEFLFRKVGFSRIYTQTANVLIHAPKKIFRSSYIHCILKWPLATSIIALGMKTEHTH